MVSTKLVRLIEEHWDNIARRAVRRIRACSDLPHLQQMPESEVHQALQRTLQKLGHWLSHSPEKEIAAQYQEIGRQRCHESMPLHEAVRGLQLMKEAALGYIRDEGFVGTSVEILAEEELEHHLGRFYDLLVFHLVKGYEEELRRGQALAAAAAQRR
jgi:hypothetical protein